MGPLDYHSNLGLNSANQMGQTARHATVTPDAGLEIADIDGTPAVVAAVGMLAIVTLVFLKRAGFRFDFGITASAGK